MATVSGGQVPRKPTAWEDLKTVTRVLQADGTYAEGTAALLYGWDATNGAYSKLTVDHATGALNVYNLSSTGSLLFGSGVPASGTGSNGDTYFDYTNERFYGPKASGSWPAVIAIGTHTSLGFVATPTAASQGKGLKVTQSGGTGTYSGGWGPPGPAFNEIVITSDNIDTTLTTFYGFSLDWVYGGSNTTGSRGGISSYMRQSAPTSATNTTRSYVSMGGISETSGTGDGGTNTGAGALGTYFGGNWEVRSAATNVLQLCGAEFDIFGTAAATQKYVMGVSVLSGNVNQGVSVDAAYELHTGGIGGFGPGIGFKTGLLFAELANGLAPISTGGTLIGTFLESLTNFTVSKGIDFSKVVFSSNALALGTGASQFTVQSTGQLGIGMAPTGAGVEVYSTGQFFPQALLWADYNGAQGAYFNFRKSRAGGPSQVGDALGTFVFAGYDSNSASQNAVFLSALVTSVAAGVVGGSLSVTGGKFILQAAQTAYASLNIPALGGTPTSVVAGDIWSDGRIFYGSPAATQTGIIPTHQIATVNSGAKTSLTNNSTSAQAVFAAANDVFTVQATTAYRFRAHIMLNTGATSHTTAFTLALTTATLTSIHYIAQTTSSGADTLATPQMRRSSAAAVTVLNAASTAVTTDIVIEGIMRVNVAGTITPQVTFSAGPTGTCEVEADSYFELWPIGSNTVVAVGPWA